jgi:hypothetical protein
MWIKKNDRNIMLLATMTLLCTVVAGTLALLEPETGQVQATFRENQVAGNRPVDGADPSPVRVVGTPFVPNVNPRER